MAKAKLTLKTLNDKADLVGRRIEKVTCYRLIIKGTVNEGGYCRDLEDVERRLNEIAQEGDVCQG